MTTRSLHLAKDLNLPLDAVTETFAILGRRGSGKTHTAVVMAEEMLRLGVPVVVIDPLDVWWGLRVSKDGKNAGFPIYVCGGSHEDVPLTADAGKVLADAVVDRGLSMVLSIRHLSKTDQRRFVGDFTDRLYDRKADPKHRTALHVFVDEADSFVPQRLVPGSERCFGAVDTLVRRGRSSGLAVTLISQRPQVINKDVLSQTEVLVSHQLTGPQDRKALEAWIVANDTENRQAEFMGSLASLKRGQAWFWSPGLLGIFTHRQVRDRLTFDSSATPKPGVTTAAPKAFAEVDLEKLTEEIAATIEKAKADDPRELRKQIAQLTTALKKSAETGSAKTAHTEIVERKVLTDADRSRLDKLNADIGEVARTLGINIAFDADDLIARVSREIARTAKDMQDELGDARTAFLAAFEAKSVQKILGKLATVTPAPIPNTTPTAHVPPRNPLAGRVAPAPATSRPARQVSHADGAVLAPGERKILIAVAQFGEVDRGQLTVIVGYKATARDTYISRLASKGLVISGNGRVRVTEAGVEALGPDYEPLPTGSALLAHWRGRLPVGEVKVLDAIVAAHPGSISRDELGERVGYKPTARDTYISRLASRRLVQSDGRGTVRASEELFS